MAKDSEAWLQRPAVRWLIRGVIATIVVGAAILLYRTLSSYSYDELRNSLVTFPGGRLALAGAFAALSYLTLTAFDMLALIYIERPLPYPKVALASFTGLSIGHNIGVSSLSSGAVRYRFYSRWGLRLIDVAKLSVFSGVTVTLGLTLLGGIASLARPDLVQKATGLGRPLVLAIGIASVSACVAYLALAKWRRKPLQLWKYQFEFPTLRVASAQLLVGVVNFSFVAACLHQALSATAEVEYLQTAAVYVLANVSWLVSHVPGGLGVLESVVLLLIPQGQIIGALLIFRFVYFLVPLALGLISLSLMELLGQAQKSPHPHHAAA